MLADIKITINLAGTVKFDFFRENHFMLGLLHRIPLHAGFPSPNTTSFWIPFTQYHFMLDFLHPIPLYDAGFPSSNTTSCWISFIQYHFMLDFLHPIPLEDGFPLANTTLHAGFPSANTKLYTGLYKVTTSCFTLGFIQPIAHPERGTNYFEM